MASPRRANGAGRNGSELSPDYPAVRGEQPKRRRRPITWDLTEIGLTLTATVELDEQLIVRLKPGEVFKVIEAGRKPVMRTGHLTFEDGAVWETVGARFRLPDVGAVLEWEAPRSLSIVGIERDRDPDAAVALLMKLVPMVHLYLVPARRKTGPRGGPMFSECVVHAIRSPGPGFPITLAGGRGAADVGALLTP